MVSSSQLILLTCRSGEPVHWLVSMKEKITQKFNTYLAARVVAIAGPSLLTLIIIALVMAPVIALQNKKIASIEKKPCECDKLVEGNKTTQITELQSQLKALKEEMDKALQLTQQNLSQLERNLMSTNEKISELETQVSDLNETVREKISELETQVSDMDETVREKISELETQVSDMDETVREKISELETQVSDMDETVREKISELETQVSDMDETVREKISELETQVSDMDETVREKISELETQVSDMDETVREKISELETQVSDLDETVRANDEEMQTALAGIGRAYNGTVERVSAVERAQAEIEIGLRHTREGLTNTTLSVESTAGQLQNLAVELSDTTARTESVAAGLDSVRSDIDSLNATKASWQALEDSTARLDRDKVGRAEFEVLSANLTSLAEASSNEDDVIRQELSELADSSLNQTHYDTLHQTIQQLDSSKASQTDLEALATEVSVLSNSTVRTTTFHQQVENIESTTLQLQYSINQLRLNVTSIDGRVRQINVTLATKAELLDSVRSDIESLNATKASWQALEDSTARLDRDKVGRAEFEVLSANLTSLAEASSNEDDVIRQELSELADSSLNQTHYDTLHQTIQQLDSSKASQTDLEALATEVSVLSVRTTTFHQQVESIESTTLQLQYSINQLRLNITSIDGRVRQINVTLATKANQVSLDRLQTSKVDTQTFQKLEGTVRNLNSSKANESDLSSLRITVNSLRDTAGSNTDRIEQLESSSSGLTASWVTVSMSVILVTLSLTILIYPL